MKNNFKNIFLTVFLSICFLFSFNSANAALVNCGRSANDPCTINDLFNLNGGTSSSPFWINLIQTALGISGIIILCVFIFSGAIMMFSGGDAKKIDKAKKMMLGSFGGIILVFFSFTIVKAGLMLLVGDKWSIYFGNNQISTTTTTTTTTPTISGNCTDNTNCLPTEYCCIGDRYDLSGTKCTSSGKCLTKKSSSTAASCVDDSECKTSKCVTGPYGAKLCGCSTDGSGDCKNTNTDYCCNGSLTSAGLTCSVPDVCNIIHFAYYPAAANKLKTSAGTVIENGRICGTSNDGSCIYVKKTIIDSTYYKAEWNLDSDNCDGRDTGDAVGGAQPRCFDLDGIRYCLRCMKTDIYNIKK